ncbi:MAG: phosphodiester glycosidase family protein [Myxococcota bacterium]|jgi:hypothetical protein
MTALLLALVVAAPPAERWRSLAPGVEYRTFELEKRPEAGDGRLHVVRVDPALADLDFALASEHGGATRTAGQWADEQGFVAAINAGMYQTDYRKNVGYLRHGEHVNNGRWKSSYQSVLAFGSLDGGAPAVMVDRDAPDAGERIAGYGSAVQNLRLLKAPGVNVWSPNGRTWSEALVAQDAQGRVLFLFTRTPFEMVELNQRLLALPLGLVRAMHVEGGPEASLSIRADGLKLDLSGSYETGFFTSDGNDHQWRIPNALGVRARPTVRGDGGTK